MRNWLDDIVSKSFLYLIHIASPTILDIYYYLDLSHQGYGALALRVMPFESFEDVTVEGFPVMAASPNRDGQNGKDNQVT